jgi:hemoglobin
MKRIPFVLAMSLFLVATVSIAGPEKVGFPAEYKGHLLYTTVDRPDNKTVRNIYASPEGAKQAMAGRPPPSGSVLTMEVYRAKMNEKGEPVKDANCRFIKGDFTGLFVMEKRTGWGAEYLDSLRNGEWEYARFGPDGKAPANVDTKPCFDCHKPMGGQDFVFTFPQLLAAPK